MWESNCLWICLELLLNSILPYLQMLENNNFLKNIDFVKNF